MKQKAIRVTMDGNTAAAYASYAFTEVATIYQMCIRDRYSSTPGSAPPASARTASSPAPEPGMS